jgi:hypothetical protein
VVGVLGMAVTIAMGAASFSVIYTILDRALPLDEGDRVVTPRRALSPYARRRCRRRDSRRRRPARNR